MFFVRVVRGGRCLAVYSRLETVSHRWFRFVAAGRPRGMACAAGAAIAVWSGGDCYLDISLARWIRGRAAGAGRGAPMIEIHIHETKMRRPDG